MEAAFSARTEVEKVGGWDQPAKDDLLGRLQCATCCCHDLCYPVSIPPAYTGVCSSYIILIVCTCDLTLRGISGVEDYYKKDSTSCHLCRCFGDYCGIIIRSGTENRWHHVYM